jgi:hypothetical protein
VVQKEMGRPKLLTDAQEAEAEARYLAGEKTDAIAAAFGCDRKTVSSALKRRGVDFRRPVPSEDGRRRIGDASRRAWAAGKSPPMYGKSHSQDARTRMSAAQKGEKNPQWRGGVKKVKAQSIGSSWSAFSVDILSHSRMYITVTAKKTTTAQT